MPPIIKRKVHTACIVLIQGTSQPFCRNQRTNGLALSVILPDESTTVSASELIAAPAKPMKKAETTMTFNPIINLHSVKNNGYYSSSIEDIHIQVPRPLW